MPLTLFFRADTHLVSREEVRSGSYLRLPNEANTHLLLVHSGSAVAATMWVIYLNVNMTIDLVHGRVSEHTHISSSLTDN